MKYFCAKCKEKHEVTDIAVDLWEICQDDVRVKVNELLGTIPELGGLVSNLTNFLGDQDRSGRMFLFKGSQIQGLLANHQKEGDVHSGIFTLKLAWLIESYRAAVAGTKEEETLTACEAQVKVLYDQIVFQRELKFTFVRVGAYREEMFDNVTDEHENPFVDPSTGLKRGYLRSCPHCGGRLSTAVGRAPEIVIALSGAPRAGKTSCLTAVASALVSGKFNGLSLDVPANDQMWDKLSVEIARFNHSIKVEKTPTDQTEVPAFSFLTRIGKDRRVLTFVDMPGEYWKGDNGLTEEFHTQYMGLYRNIDCIWLFVSKLTVHQEAMRQKEITDACGEMDATASGALHVIPENASLSMAAILSSLRGYLNARELNVPPMAVIVTKAEANLGNGKEIRENKMFPFSEGDISFDVYAENRKELEAVAPFMNGSFHLRERKFFERSQAVRNYLRAKNGMLLQSIENNCGRKTYISMAAYGHKAGDLPAKGEIPSGSAPEAYHELFPLVWTLAITGAIPVSHRVMRLKKNMFGTPRIESDREEDIFYHYKATPPAKNKKDAMRLQAIWSDITKNLFSMTKDYQTTEIDVN